MNENIIAESNPQLKDTLNSFITSYAERGSEIAFSEWLEQKLQQEMPGISQEAGKRLAGEIIQAVADYDNALNELNNAVESGQSADEWFAEKLEKEYNDIPMDIVGEKLLQIEEVYTVSNIELMKNDGNTHIEVTGVIKDDEYSWNRYSIKSKLYDIGKQVAMNGVAVAAVALKNKVENDADLNINDAVNEVLQNGLIENPSEVKAIVAGAMKVAAEKGIEKALPSNTPTEYICDVAGVAVEGAEAIFDAARGKITATEAVDRTGKAAVAAGCRIGSSALKGLIATAFPVVSPLLVEILGGLFDYMESPKFFNNVYTIVSDAAKATWEGLKNFGNTLFKN